MVSLKIVKMCREKTKKQGIIGQKFLDRGTLL